MTRHLQTAMPLAIKNARQLAARNVRATFSLDGLVHCVGTTRLPRHCVSLRQGRFIRTQSPDGAPHQGLGRCGAIEGRGLFVGRSNGSLAIVGCRMQMPGPPQLLNQLPMQSPGSQFHCVDVVLPVAKSKPAPQYRQFKKSQFCRRRSLRQKQRRTEMQTSAVVVTVDCTPNHPKTKID